MSIKGKKMDFLTSSSPLDAMFRLVNEEIREFANDSIKLANKH